MKQIKHMVMKVVFVVEVCLFGYVYLCGKNGFQMFFEKRRENAALAKTVSVLENEVAQIEFEMNRWQSDDFFKEKIAREQLQMARDGDEIFYIGS